MTAHSMDRVIAHSMDRVPAHTRDAVNRAIHAQTQRCLEYFRWHPDEIDARLADLDAEWDVERVLETASSCFSLLGLAAGFTRNRRWLTLPVVVQGFLLQHALQGWCPPLPAIRRLGFRTQAEITRERCALEALRGAPTSRPAVPAQVVTPAQASDGATSALGMPH